MVQITRELRMAALVAEARLAMLTMLDLAVASAASAQSHVERVELASQSQVSAVASQCGVRVRVVGRAIAVAATAAELEAVVSKLILALTHAPTVTVFDAATDTVETASAAAAAVLAAN